MHVYFDAYLGVTDGKISYLAREAPKEKTKRLVPGEGMVLMPGLINCHTHLPMSVLRGYADDVELSSWLNDYIFPQRQGGSPAVHCRVRPLRHDIHLGYV